MPWDKNRPRARQSQHLSPKMRAKIIRRDRVRGCWFKYPGCTGLTGKVEIHHLIEAEDGGKDREDNLVLACRHCHQHYSAQRSQQRAVEAAWSWQRKPEKHPGVLD